MIADSEAEKICHLCSKGIGTSNNDEDIYRLVEDGYGSSTVIPVSSIVVKNVVSLIKLIDTTMLPYFLSWIFLDRN